MTALDYMLANVIPVAIGFAVFFAVLPFGLWIGKVLIVAGLEKMTE